MFKVGDAVYCINPRSWKFLEKDKIYIVKELGDIGGEPCIKVRSQNCKSLLFASRFVLASEARKKQNNKSVKNKTDEVLASEYRKLITSATVVRTELQRRGFKFFREKDKKPLNFIGITDTLIEKTEVTRL